jgi:hypothetical protein
LDLSWLYFATSFPLSTGMILREGYPMASDFLAECILLEIDEEMSKKYAYFRYVDDIRILGKTELEVRQALVHLDILCKSKGLIPNSDKTKLKQVTGATPLQWRHAGFRYEGYEHAALRTDWVKVELPRFSGDMRAFGTRGTSVQGFVPIG